MNGHLEIWGPRGPELIALQHDRYTIGRADGNDVTLASDPEVSQLHAVLERYAGGWSIRDLGSTNGTHVNGDRIVAERALRQGDQVVVGTTRLVLRVTPVDALPPTRPGQAAPALTRREREVLVALCRPLVEEGAFRQPASVRQLAQELFVSPGAVKFHLGNLYDKFGLAGEGQGRKLELANEAIRRRAVSLPELLAGDQASEATR